MSEPRKHHYVPQTYLKSFGDSQKRVFEFNKATQTIRTKAISQICYLKDFYKINRPESLLISNLEDVYDIERKIFGEQEKNLAILLKKVIQRSHTPFPLSYANVEQFIKTLITVKRRNPSVRNTLAKAVLNKFNSEQFPTLAMQDLKEVLDALGINPLNFIGNYIQSVNKDKTRLLDSYLSKFVEKDNIISKVTDTLLNHRIEIYHAPDNVKFITSDNPGFFVEGNHIINFGGLGGNFAFIFPLTPACVLLIDAEKKDRNNSDGRKLIYSVNIDKDTVLGINNLTFQIANQHVYSFGVNMLEGFKSETPK